MVDQQILEKAKYLSIFVDAGVAIPETLHDENTLFQAWKKGALVAQSRNAPNDPVIDFDDGFHIVSYASRRWRTISLTTPEDQVRVIVAQRFDVYTALTEGILLEAILPIVWVLPLIGMLVLFVINVGLKPLERLANTLSEKDGDDFSPLDSDQYTGEMIPIVDALNNLFRRLYEAFERERRFSADAAHELRTPLAALKVGLHNMSRDSGSNSNLLRLHNTIERMGHSVEQLLTMHRVSLDIDTEDLKDCDLETITREVISEMYGQIHAKSQVIELSGGCATITGNSFSIAMLLRNLIDNAIKYTPAKGSIHVTIQGKPKSVRVLVEDSGPGIPDSEYSRVEERFYRIGGDQHSSGITGSGLGLSIVSFVAHLHRGAIFYSESSELGGLAVEIVFPAIDKQGRR